MIQELSLTGKRWIIPEKEIETSAILESLLSDRGIDPDQDGELIDPTLIHDVPKAVKRIRKAIKKGETIGIFGDYDCDGVTSALIMMRYFKRQGIDPLIRLPHRIHDGYGIKEHIIGEFAQKGTDLLITVDSGIGSINEIARAKEIGIDVIITDHHHVGKRLPQAHAIVHPALSSKYPEPYPSGSGVTFHLVRALEDGDWEDMHIDQALAMLGTIADVMELRGQNRTMVKQGIAALNKLNDEPLAALIKSAGLNKYKVTSTDIAFRIAPRINAAGRISDPLIALQALMNGGEALEHINELNELRQSQTEKFMNKALEQIGDCRSTALIAIAHEDFPQGIVGLIAGKLTEKFGKPSLVGRIHDGLCTASLRSPECYHITKGLERCKKLLQYYGGHAQAAGCSFRADLFEKVSKELCRDAEKQTDPEELVPTINIDAVLDANSVTLDLCNNLKQLEPFGQGNREPVFMIENVKIDYPRLVGKEENHLQGKIEGTKMIGFRLGEVFGQISETVDVICRLGTDSWQGTTQPQLFIEDIRVTKPKKVLTAT
ncbi:single-stranded-DNA-specific exonuclease RecJ [Patescibacteria group bacterium]|nr:single-stranded-DNA-specific exonuclease RecJ [Patescibacteria group bacterium]MBU1123317.1 single-stranded-DNA-specific exonuclease RecJ [Patescibacteria group bacterium]